MIRIFIATAGLAMLAVTSLVAGEVDVEKVTITQASDGTYSVSTQLRHADEGWEHYADAWQVLDGEGNVLATRVLVHPHVDEQPFTRSKSGIVVPDDLKTVTIRGRDKVHGFGGKTIEVELPGR